MNKKLGRIRELLLPLAGFGALLWFLIRVIPKPSRARYPCMRAAAPLASSFVIGLLSFASSVLFFKKARRFFYRSRYAIFASCVAAGAVFAFISLAQVSPVAAASPSAAKSSAVKDAVKLPNDGPNMPMGQGQGIFPGRVVWVHDPAATNEKFANGYGSPYWFDAGETNQSVVDSMLERSLRELTGEATVADSWRRLFADFNVRHGRSGAGYAKGEKIVIKINLNGTGNGPNNVNTLPQLCHSLLDELVNTVGVAQNCIYLGDPNIAMNREMYYIILKDFPKVHYWGYGLIVESVKPTKNDVIFASDGGMKDPLPQAYVDAAYMINIPVLKKHHRAGISLTAKNHFGSITPFNSNGAFNWHYSLPVPNGNAANTNGDYGVYRCLVDFMGHKDLGGKTVLFLVDGLWGSINWGHPAIKWRMSPFNNDWPSSIFVSQDGVAIDSVGFDFLFNEFDRKHPTEGAYDSLDDHGPFPHYNGVDDYLHQAADPKNWPAGLVYDPEKDGTPIGSLGTHEHWNNPVDRQYTRNLGGESGIELVYVEGAKSAAVKNAVSSKAKGAAAGATMGSTKVSSAGTGLKPATNKATSANAADASLAKVFGEFEDMGLFDAGIAKNPEMKNWNEKNVCDGSSGATIQVKSLGIGTGRGEVFLDGKKVADADGFGQFWFALSPGTYALVGKCPGYKDVPVGITVSAGEVAYRNFYMIKRR